MSKYITLRKQLHHIEKLAQREPLSYEIQDEILKITLESMHEIDRLEFLAQPQICLQIVETEKEVV
jgi:hypothetical protein